MRSTTRRSPYTPFALLVSALLAVFAAVLTQRVLRWEAYFGGQTRAGSLPESDYGWNRPQEFFAARHYRVIRDPKDYDQAYDIVVVGDSFSGSEYLNSWLDYLENESGAKILCLWTDRPLDVPLLLEQPAFRQTPPRLFIYETVERQLLQRLGEFADLGGAAEGVAEPARAPPLLLKPARRERHQLDREKDASLLQKLREVAAALQTALHLRLRADDIRIARLTTDALFSSKHSSEVLLLGLDNPKRRLGPADTERAARGLRRVQRFVQSNHFTHFELLAFPDKSSIYAPYLAEVEYATPNLIAELSAQEPIHRTDTLLGAALAAGTVDLYWPDDSHTSGVGNQLIAAWFRDELVRTGEFAVAKNGTVGTP